VVFIIASYLLFSELWPQEFDKLLCALTMSNLKGRVLTLWWSGWCSMCLVIKRQHSL